MVIVAEVRPLMLEIEKFSLLRAAPTRARPLCASLCRARCRHVEPRLQPASADVIGRMRLSTLLYNDP